MMKDLDNTKKTVLVIGALSVVAGIVGLFTSQSLMEPFFSFHIGGTLIGTVLLHKVEKTENK